MDQKVCQSLSDIKPVPTVHNLGEKFVFLKNEDTPTAITQFAFGKLMPGEDVEEHLHQTMEECFYFIGGEGEYTVNNIVYHVKPETFLRIPANTMHSLKITSAIPLTFVYFGVALD